MANTTNLNLVKLEGTEKLKTYPTSFNGNMDTIDGAVGNEISTTRTVTQAISKAEESIAIVANGNTHVAIASGQYVYVKNHGSLAEGLYTATTAISTNATLSGSNLNAVSGGGLNNVYSTLNNNLSKFVKYKTVSGTTTASGNLMSDLVFASTFVIGAYIPGNSTYIIQPWTYEPSGNWYFRVFDTSTGQVVVSTSVVIRAIYVESREAI